MINSIEFFFVEAFTALRRSALMTTVAIGTVIVSLVIFGLFMVLIVNLGNLVSSIGTKMDISAYVARSLDPKQASEMQLKISGIEGVQEVSFISQEENWEKFQKQYGGRLNLGDIIDENPLPNTFVVKIRTAELVPMVAKQVSSIPGIDEVRYRGELLKQISDLISVVRIWGFFLVVLLCIATLLIVVNTIRLTVLAREVEIAIMRLVGATNSFIIWPFIIEGLLIGTFGGVAAIIILRFSYAAMALKLSSTLPFLPIVKGSPSLTLAYFMVVVFGMLLGMLGGYISVSRILKKGDISA